MSKHFSPAPSGVTGDSDIHSAGEGALTGGVSAIRSVATKATVTVGSEIIKNTLDVKVKGGKPNVKVNDAKSVARNTVIGLAVNGRL